VETRQQVVRVGTRKREERETGKAGERWGRRRIREREEEIADGR